MAVAIEQYVLWLEVAVDDAELVQVLQRQEDCARVEARLVRVAVAVGVGVGVGVGVRVGVGVGVRVRVRVGSGLGPDLPPGARRVDRARSRPPPAPTGSRCR